MWRIGTSDADVAPTALRHDALPGAHRVTRGLDLQAESRFGKLHVVAVDERGAPLPKWGATLRAVDRDLQYDDSRRRAPPEGQTWELPAGTWDLHVLLGKEVIFSPHGDSYVRGSTTSV